MTPTLIHHTLSTLLPILHCLPFRLYCKLAAKGVRAGLPSIFGLNLIKRLDDNSDKITEPRHEFLNNVVCAGIKG